MKNVSIELNNVEQFVDYNKYLDKAHSALNCLYKRESKGSNFLGWLNLPNEIDDTLIQDINNTAIHLRSKCDIVVVVGIGGSYLGAKAVIEGLSGAFDNYCDKKKPKVVFAGQNLSEDYLYELTACLRGKHFGIICISKSGTTTEPAVAFRILKNQLEDEAGVERARQLIVCITDRKKGALRTLATQEGYKTFVIEDNIGGRFSVFSPVGLLPIAVAGFDISEFIKGGQSMIDRTAPDVAIKDNIAVLYAAVRNALYHEKAKKIEILVNSNHKLRYIAEWWKQLFGESEGKDGKGLFPAAVNFTTDLHSVGQLIQDGERTIFETVISVHSSNGKLAIPYDEENLDGLNYLAGKNIDYVNKMAERGAILAHVDGNVPNLRIVVPSINEYYVAQLLFFFEIACGISAYILEVNPFDQPGVENYKNNMFSLLEKPGYEEQTKEIYKRIKK